MSRRDQIRMSDNEVAAFLEHERTMTCGTNGPRGLPHLMPLWYVLREPPAGEPGPRLWAWTFAKSQKAQNLERDARAALQIEDGEQYQELRGVMLECDVVIHRDFETVRDLGGEILRRYAGPPGSEPPLELAPEAQAMVDAQARKRIGMEFVERRRVSWDHRKLDGVY